MAITQGSLFQEPGVKVKRCGLCIYEKHCGNKAEYGPPVDLGGCINLEIRCQKCGATGVQSWNKELMKKRDYDEIGLSAPQPDSTKP